MCRTARVPAAIAAAFISMFVANPAATDSFVGRNANLVGTTPVDFKFPLTERDATFQGEDAGGNVTRRYKEGLLRIILSGYLTEERSVLFTGNKVTLEHQLMAQ